MSASASNKSSRSLSTLTLIWCSILTFRLIPMGLSGVSTLTVGVQPPTATRVISRLVKSSLVKSLPVQCIRSGPDLAEVRAPEQAQESASRLVLVIDIDIAITLLFAVERRDALRPVFLNSLSLDLAARPASISLPLQPDSVGKRSFALGTIGYFPDSFRSMRSDKSSATRRLRSNVPTFSSTDTLRFTSRPS